MATFSRKKKTIIILTTALAAAALTIGMTVYAAYGESEATQRTEAEQPAARRAVTDAILAAAEAGSQVPHTSDVDIPQEDLVQSDMPTSSEAEDSGIAEVTPPAPETVQEPAAQQPPSQQDYAPAADVPAASATAPAPEVSPPAVPPQTWVVTRAAWTEQVAVYGTIESAICNGCGADITGTGPTAHAKSVSEEAKMNGCGAWHTQYSEGIIGYKDVYHPEEGYWQ